jgi:hypothetical protein
MKVVRADARWLESQGVQWNMTKAENIDAGPYKYWLVGSARGSASTALMLFRANADLAVGMLAISAASIHRRGAARIRIGVVMSPETSHGAAAWLSWAARDQQLVRHFKFRDFHDFKIDATLVQQFIDSGVFVRAFELLQSDTRSELEDAFVKAVHWYSDAQREVVPVMKLVKFWSCVETFFSASKVDIVQSVSVGLTCVLIFGGFDFIAESEYKATKKQVTDLYGQRSDALHAGEHKHVSERDTAKLSQWVAWMLLNIVSFIDRGYSRLDEIKKIGEDINKRLATPPSSTAQP